MSGRGRKPLDIAGKRFGRLIAVEDVGSSPKARGRLWRCVCDCGGETTVAAGYLTSGNTASCGCGQRDAAARACVARSSHGLSDHRIWSIHRGMIARCYTPTAISYPYYGGRGIEVCDEWHDFANFAAWAFANGYDDALTIERKDNDQGYSPGNCRWATYKEQANHRTNNFLITYEGQTKNILQWAEVTGIGVTTLRYRIEAGWDAETALTRERNRGMRYLG